MKLGYICTNFNNATYTVQAVETLLANRGHEIAILVVDNHSNPEDVGRLEELADRHAEVRLILQDENVGYFAGLNAGIHHLRANFPDMKHIVIGNNDLVFGPGFIDSIDKRTSVLQEHPVLSPDIVTLDGLHQNPHVISGISWKREIIYDLYHLNYWFARVIQWLAKITHRFTDRSDEIQWQVAQSIYQGHGSCYILGPLFLENFTELWAPTFLFGEEYFISKQLNDKGLMVYYEPSITVQHHCHAAIGKMPAKKMWMFSRDAHRVYRQHVKVFS